MLLVWLQSTLSKSILLRVLGSNHSYQVWEKIHQYFSLHTKSRARQLRTAMRIVTLDSKSIYEYLCNIKGYVDELAGVRVLVRHEQYVDAFLEGLPSDYVSIISVIESKKRTPPSIAEIKALLYGHETCLTRYNRDAQVISSASLNYTQGYSHQNSYKTCGSGRGSGGGRFANFQCQICLKYGHTANVFHFRFDMNFQPYDPTTLQPIPYSIGSVKASNTWVNPNSKVVVPGPSQLVLCSQILPLMGMVLLALPGFQTLEPVFM